MHTKKETVDSIVLKQKKGVWLRFIRVFPKCHLPWGFLAIYIILNLGFVNIGLSETDYTAQLFAGDTSAALLTKLVGIIILNLIGSNLVIFFRQITSARINRNMRSVVLDQVMRLPMSFFKKENPREAVYRIVSNSIVIDSTIMLVLLPLVTAFYKAFSIFGRIFRYDWRLSAVLIAFIPIQFFLAFLFGRINFSLTEREASIKAGLTQRLAELVTNIPLAKAFAKEEREAGRGEELTERLYKVDIKTGWFGQFEDLSRTAVDLLQSAVIVLVGVVLLRGEMISTRAWFAFFMFSSLFTGAITEFVMYWSNVKTIQGGADRVAEIMDAPKEDQAGEACTELTGDIRLQEVCFGYEEEQPVLKGVSCEFKDHCITALLGASGCGKTTLMNLLTRLYEPWQGAITIGDRPVSDYALDDYREQFVMVSQNGMLFSGTVRENVCYGREQVSQEDFTKALVQAGAYDFVQEMKDGADTLLEEYGNNLSGGQRQRLCVARALLSQAHYLILDEPAASMDAIATAELMEILREAARGRCMIVIAHTAAVLAIAERAVILEDGVVSAQGAVEELMGTSRFLREFSGNTFKDESDGQELAVENGRGEQR